MESMARTGFANWKPKNGKQVIKGQSPKIPGMPKIFIVCPIDSEKISVVDQKLYHSRIGMLLYIIKNLRPGIVNMVQELSKVMDGVKQAKFLEMHQVIKYALDTRRLI